MRRDLVVLFGGTFDPIHVGHVSAAQAARAELGVDAVTLVPSARPPHRNPVASAAHRLRMLRLAIADEPGLKASDVELRRRGRSYTIDTVRAFGGPRRSVVWLLGSDGLAAFGAWRGVAALPRSGHVVVLVRPGAAPGGLARFRRALGPTALRHRGAGCQLALNAPMLNVSATDIRRRLRRGEDASHLLNPAVWHYIWRHGLYRD